MASSLVDQVVTLVARSRAQRTTYQVRDTTYEAVASVGVCLRELSHHVSCGLAAHSSHHPAVRNTRSCRIPKYMTAMVAEWGRCGQYFGVVQASYTTTWALDPKIGTQ
ncbi:hypothetical protein NUW58_g5779 [Xylaria curta]|uniref:Uncharacterized protein n=1 Tax=Xylaria curta TaxID=42375 RepID=A0ACC1P181_9PEZI|nr:hypothetical protein NUW58_g5779 [Xylaria curta]